MEPNTKKTRRMRTAPRILEALRAEDPETEVTLHFIRYLIRAELVPVVHVGRKKLAAVEDVQAFLAAPTIPEPEPGIRRVAV